MTDEELIEKPVIPMRANIIRHEDLMVSYSVVNSWTILELDGEVDIHTAPMIGEAVSMLLEDGHLHFVLDFGFVTFMDSTGLGTLVKITKRIGKRGGSLRIASASGRIFRVFELSGLSGAYDFRPSAEDAARFVPSEEDFSRNIGRMPF
jgi:anti-sigma B factor antagonist